MGGLSLVMDGQGQMRVSEVDALSARCFDPVLCARSSTNNCYLPRSPHLWNRDNHRPYLLRVAGDAHEIISKKHLGGFGPRRWLGAVFAAFRPRNHLLLALWVLSSICEWWKNRVCVQGGSTPGQAGARMAGGGRHGGRSGPATLSSLPAGSHTPDTEQVFSRPGCAR